jgi:ribosomal RNA-processing protein 12
VRKAAQHAICSILRGSNVTSIGQKSTSLHPVASHAGKWFQEEITKRKDEKGPAFLHLLGLLKDVISVLPQSQVQVRTKAS